MTGKIILNKNKENKHQKQRRGLEKSDNIYVMGL
jgi:hypothetical protein